MTEYRARLRRLGVVPVVVLREEEEAERLGEALCLGGLPCAEVTFRTPAAEGAIRRLRRAFPHMLVGAGTVLTGEQADRALDAGAEFLVSPGLDEKVAARCLERRVPMIPGVVTPSEIQRALGLGLEAVKFFPAQAFGGVKTIRSLSGPFPGLEFLPTGGIGPEHLREYLSQRQVLACGGSWMVKEELIAGGRFDEIQALCAQAAAIVKEVRG